MKPAYKYRGILYLTLLFVVLPWCVWCFVLSDTLETWRDCNLLTTRLNSMTSDMEHPVCFAAQERDLVLSGALLDSVRSAVTDLSVRISGYEPLVTAEHDGMAVHTARLTLIGDYIALLQAMAGLENSLPACRLRSLEWRGDTDRRTRRTQLTLNVYIQQVVLKK